MPALIQLMAAAVAEREVCYFTFKDNKLTQDIYDIHQLITDHGLTVGKCFISIASDNYVDICCFIKNEFQFNWSVSELKYKKLQKSETTKLDVIFQVTLYYRGK